MVDAIYKQVLADWPGKSPLKLVLKIVKLLFLEICLLN